MTVPAYSGQRLGLPPQGPGSVASLLRRLLAILVDWTLCQVVATGLFDLTWGEVAGLQAFAPLGLLLLLNLVLVPTIGTTPGHRLLGIRVVSLDGDGDQPPPPARAAVRAVLLCLAVPAIILDADSRGLHDRAARSVVVNAR
ncbi:RDD family protein [Ornithinimicrobium sp. W1665]|uniref:RDD family protein n=1 Tax=Ornithinimicrobium sp. W1665 TaxID=3416666 RepID=UPI003CF72811